MTSDISTNDELKRINEIIDRIESKLETINRKLEILTDEIDRYNNNKPRSLTTTMNDGEIMFRYNKQQNNNDSIDDYNSIF